MGEFMSLSLSDLGKLYARVRERDALLVQIAKARNHLFALRAQKRAVTDKAIAREFGISVRVLRKHLERK